LGPTAWAAVPQSEKIAAATANPKVWQVEPRVEWRFMAEIKSEHSECPHLNPLVQVDTLLDILYLRKNGIPAVTFHWHRSGSPNSNPPNLTHPLFNPTAPD
jgi:hypothetical protein